MEIIMETQQRLEKRIFLPMDKCQLLVKRITDFKLLYRCYFDFPVSETIYFTLNDLSRSLYDGVYIRVRKYVKFISEKMLLDGTIAYLEIKERKQNSSVVFKKRYKTTSRQAAEMLSQKSNDFSGFLPVKCPPLCPFVGTQVERLHWQSGGLRITIDPDTFFFGFKGIGDYEGRKIGNLNETKIEFKYDTVSDWSYCAEIEKEILADMDFYLRDKEYMEKRLRKCYIQQVQI